MTIAKKLGLALAAFGLIGFLALPQPAMAWRTSQSGHSACSESTPNVVLNWSFTNTEPNDAKWAMDVVARDTVSGNSSPKVTVNPGETATGSIDTGLMKVGKGSIVFDLTWTDGRSGVDDRTVHYSAVDCTPPEAPEFTAHVICEVVNDEAVYILRILQTNTVEAEFDPADGTSLPNGNSVEVTATYANGDLQVTKTAEDATDCTPPLKIKVCRDGEIIEVEEDEVLETDTENLEDCGDEPEEEKPQILPVTGPGAFLAGLFGLGTLSTTVRSWFNSKKSLRSALLR